jgi:hypothetical protein
MSDSSRGHKISTRDGSGIDLDLTYKFLEYRSLCHCHLEHKALRQQLFLIVTSQ